MKAYISGPMTGFPKYKMHFDKAEKFLRSWGFEVINPSKLTYVMPESETSHYEYLQVDLKMLELCDIIYMLDGYENSPGAMTELSHAKELCIPAFYQKDYETALEAET